MKKAEADAIRGVVGKLEEWMKVETDVIVNGRRPEVPGESRKGQHAIRAEAVGRRDEIFALIRILRPLAEEER